MRTARDGAHALRRALADSGGTLAEVSDGGAGEAPDAPGPAQIAASGPRTRGHAADYELLLEMILEGSRLHYGKPRVVLTGDPELALLLGDQLYALGLLRLAALGDLDAVAVLADVISLVAQAQAADNPDLADAVWEAGCVAIGWGSSDAFEAATARARAEHPDALTVVQAAGRRRDL